MGQTIPQHSTSTTSCPVRAVARRVHHILTNGGSNESLLCSVYLQSEWYHITAADMLKAIRAAVSDLQLHQGGIDPDLVGVHSLRAGGAMALKLAGADDTTIMKMGRWTSLTFLQYIHNQIDHLSAGLSSKMSTQLTFTNIASIEK